MAAVQVRAFPSKTQPVRPCCVCVVFSSPSHSCLPAALRCRIAPPGAVNLDKTGSTEGPMVAAGQVRALPLHYPAPRAHVCPCGFFHIPHLLARVVLLLHSVVDVAHVVEVGRRWRAWQWRRACTSTAPQYPAHVRCACSCCRFYLLTYLFVYCCRCRTACSSRWAAPEMSTVAAWQGTCPPQR